ncbi:MAG TPA: DUF202 domain-containing protein [Trebonia sp.]|jgi:uncharacterized membrane protein YidH (DUF202 family)
MTVADPHGQPDAHGQPGNDSGNHPGGQPRSHPGGQPRKHPGNHPGDDLEERDPGLARERTSLSWTRTAISFGALGGTVLKENAVSGLIILAMAPVIWQLGRVPRGHRNRTDLTAASATRLFIITAAIVAVSLLCLVIAIFGQAVPGALR